MANYNCSNATGIVDAFSMENIIRLDTYSAKPEHLQFILYSTKFSKLHLSAKDYIVVHGFTSLLKLTQ